MSLEKSNITWSCKQLKGMVVNGKIDFNHIVQRSFVWEKARKSGLIESMIIGYPIPPVFAKRLDDGSGKRGSNTYYIMDGKQRLSTIKEYLNDEFELTALPEVTYMDDELGEEVTTDISGLKYSQLPEALQTYLATVNISVTYFDNLTKDEERELFKRLNAGKPLSTKSRLLASCKDIEGLLDIGSHKLFMPTDGMLTEKARANKNQVTLVMKCWCMMNQMIQDVSFESKVFNPLVEETEVSETDKLAMIEVFDLIFDVHMNLIERKEKKVAKKLYTETHMVSLIPYFQKAVQTGISEDMMADWLVDFFTSDDGASVSADYNEAAGSGSAKSINIMTRNEALEASYEEFFKVDADGADDEEDTEMVLGDDAEGFDDADDEEEGSEGQYDSLVDEILKDMENTEED